MEIEKNFQDKKDIGKIYFCDLGWILTVLNWYLRCTQRCTQVYRNAYIPSSHRMKDPYKGVRIYTPSASLKARIALVKWYETTGGELQSIMSKQKPPDLDITPGKRLNVYACTWCACVSAHPLIIRYTRIVVIYSMNKR